MPWVVGIDEAGYGPNLGPLVQAAVAVRLPDHDPAGWETLKPHVRRCSEPDDGRLLIDDSKKVYSGGRGLGNLELGVMAFTMAGLSRKFTKEFLNYVLWVNEVGLRTEHWFDPEAKCPIAAKHTAIRQASEAYVLAESERDMKCSHAVCLVIPSEFNRVVYETGSKAVVLGKGLVDLLSGMSRVGEGCFPPANSERIVFLCDKLGGRNFYAAILQQAFPDGWVVAVRESAAESRYRIANLDREVEVVFRPRADAESVSVALASMLAKYLREVCMIQFNAFWRKHVPDITPTAGYPGDAKRFFDAIRPAMDKLGIPADAVWRKR
jgi:hypothetical protein